MKIKDSLVVNWVIPPPFAGSGGHTNIFRAMRCLGEFGHTINLFTERSKDFSTVAELENFIRDRFGDVNARNYSVDTPRIAEAEGDVIFATHFLTVYPVMRNARIMLKLYFIQDFEPMFVPMGGEYIMAENTYKLGLRGISSGPWCASIVRERYGMECHYFLFPVDRQIYYPRNVKRANRLLFFARPDYPRRCYYLGIEALKIFKRMRPNVEIVFYGSNKVNAQEVPFPYTDAGMLPTLERLAELYSSARAGLVFSTTNPSLVPFEMMACQCAVVDLDYNNNAINYGSEKNAILTGTMPQAIADGLMKIFCNDDLWRSTVKRAYDFVRQFPSEMEMGRRIESLVYYYLVRSMERA